MFAFIYFQIIYNTHLTPVATGHRRTSLRPRARRNPRPPNRRWNTPSLISASSSKKVMSITGSRFATRPSRSSVPRAGKERSARRQTCRAGIHSEFCLGSSCSCSTKHFFFFPPPSLRVERRSQNFADFDLRFSGWALGVCAVTGLGCIPFCIGRLKNVEHRCGNCDQRLATWHRYHGRDDRHAWS